MPEYCNITDDLQRVYRDIDRVKAYREIDLDDFELVSGNVYKYDQSGFVSMVMEDGDYMTAGSDNTPDAGEFYYEASTDRLYVHMSDSAAPSTHTKIEIGVDWDDYKTEKRDEAQDEIDSLLRKVYVAPVPPLAPGESHTGERYDPHLKKMTATLACAYILMEAAPHNPLGMKLYKRVHNPEPEQGFSGEDDRLGWIQEILNGERILAHQRVSREAGGFNYKYGSSNSTTGFFHIPQSRHGLASRQTWKIVIDTAGVPGTATYKRSTDGGSTYDLTLQATLPSGGDDRRVSIGAGIDVEFSGTFVLNDEITIEFYPTDDHLAISPGRAITAVR